MNKIKRLFTFFLAIVMVASFALPAVAEGIIPRLNDSAGLLSSKEAADISERLDEISDRQSFDIVICTVNGLPNGYSSIVDFSDDYFDYNDFGHGDMDRNGCLLVVDIAKRDWYICTTGYGRTVFTDWGIQYIGDQLKKNGLSDGKYYKAFKEFINQCDKFIDQAEKGKPFDSNNKPPMDKKAALKRSLIIGVIAGIVLAFIVMLVMLATMKSVAIKTEAGHYVVNNSQNVTFARDVFLYSKVTREKRETESRGSSSHSGSSGVSHGGGGGKF